MVNLHPLTPHVTPSYTHKMAIFSWPQILWRHFTLCIGPSRIITVITSIILCFQNNSRSWKSCRCWTCVWSIIVRCPLSVGQYSPRGWSRSISIWHSHLDAPRHRPRKDKYSRLHRYRSAIYLLQVVCKTCAGIRCGYRFLGIRNHIKHQDKALHCLLPNVSAGKVTRSVVSVRPSVRYSRLHHGSQN